jgi:hypothetical protein
MFQNAGVMNGQLAPIQSGAITDEDFAIIGDAV